MLHIYIYIYLIIVIYTCNISLYRANLKIVFCSMGNTRNNVLRVTPKILPSNNCSMQISAIQRHTYTYIKDSRLI